MGLCVVKGGWYCFNKQTCDRRYETMRSLMSSADWPQTRTGSLTMMSFPAILSLLHTQVHDFSQAVFSYHQKTFLNSMTYNRDSLWFLGRFFLQIYTINKLHSIDSTKSIQKVIQTIFMCISDLCHYAFYCEVNFRTFIFHRIWNFVASARAKPLLVECQHSVRTFTAPHL